jgi:hypothetical protein
VFVRHALVALQAPRFLAALPNAQLRWLPGLSHVPISDDPAAIVRLMIDFLADDANAGGKVLALVAGMTAGADCIDDMALLRHGGMGKLFDRPYAP